MVTKEVKERIPRDDRAPSTGTRKSRSSRSAPPPPSSSARRRRKGPGLARDIDAFTQEGCACLRASELPAAVEHFELAYLRAQQLGEDFPRRACAFNLGAVYIAVGQPAKGVEVLQQALPPQGHSDGRSNGDLFYNFALGYEALRTPTEAVRYMELALEEYQAEGDNPRMEAEVTSKMADIYTAQSDWLPAARANGLAVRAYAVLGDHENQAVTTCHEAACLFKAGRPDLALQIADECMVVCQKLGQDESLSRIYNELGLTYTQCHDFGKAATCFELALPLSRGLKRDKKQEAVILQNLGAVYNSLGDFIRAVGFHEEASRLHAELGNRNAQGQCFTNVAYAFSQLGDTEKAGEFYLHALQASKDTGDNRAQWQAMEGLGAVAFNDGKFERAVKYFKMALAVLSGTEANQPAQARLVAKLSDAIHFLAGVDEASGHDSEEQSVNILINDAPRPATREEQHQMDELRQIREERRLRRRQNQFVPVALGVSEYDTDSDISLRREKRKSRPKSSRGSSSRLQRSTSVSSRRADNGHDSNDGERTSRSLGRSSSVSARRNGQEPVSTSFRNRPNLSHAHSDDGLSRRASAVPRDKNDQRAYGGGGRRNYTRPLLRSSSFDSDEERERIVNQPRLPSSSAYKENEDYKKKMYPASEAPHSRHAAPVQSQFAAKLSSSIKNPDLEVQVFHADDQPIDPKGRSESSITRSSGMMSESVQGTETDQDHVPGPIVEEAAAELATSRPAESESEYTTGSETDSETEYEDPPGPKEETKNETLLPPAPPVPISSPNATYLQPCSDPATTGEPSQPPMTDVHTAPNDSKSDTDEEEEVKVNTGKHRLGNFFMEVPDKGPDPEDRTIGNFKDIVKKPGVNVDIHGDPIYQTIRSTAKTVEVPPQVSDEPHAGPSHEYGEADAPPLPPRPTVEDKTRAEKEAFLFEYQRKRNENLELGQGQNRFADEEESNAQLPQPKGGKSKMCSLM